MTRATKRMTMTNKPIDKITLGYGLAYFAITIEK